MNFIKFLPVPSEQQVTTLITGSADKTIKFWQPALEWDENKKQAKEKVLKDKQEEEEKEEKKNEEEEE